MNRRRSNRIALAGLILFVLLIAIAIWLQSANLLYAASLLPVFIVPFLPDIRSNQWLKAGKANKDVSLYLLKPSGAERAEFLVVEFQPGLVHWSKKMLYFPVAESKLPVFNEVKSTAASLPVLPFDLLASRKEGWFGLRLRNLLERSASFSFTYKEVGQFIIRLDDLRAVAQGRVSAPAATSGKELQA